MKRKYGKYTRRNLGENRNKKPFLWIIIIVLVIIVLYFFFSKSSLNTSENISLIDQIKSSLKLNFTQETKDTFQYTPIKEISQNPTNYFGKNVSVKGVLNFRVGGKSIQDSEGYWIWLDDNCIAYQRDYDYNYGTYTAKGVFIDGEKSEWVGYITYPRLNCISPLS